tara:strand:- start:52 stop:246 length:195 start_codon:yes stop_codon:yes gene_type:complete
MAGYKGEKQRTPYTEKTDGAYIQREEQRTPYTGRKSSTSLYREKSKGHLIQRIQTIQQVFLTKN